MPLKNSLKDMVIKRYILTEKSHKLKERNIYVFEVDDEATKQDIKNAVEKMFNKKVLDIHILYSRPKLKRKLSRTPGYTKEFKKAYVKLDSKIKELEELA